MKKFLMFVVAMLAATPALAELNNLFPRTRTFSEIGRSPDQATNDSGRRRSIRQNDRPFEFGKDKHYDVEAPRFGALINYQTDYVFRDFLISESGSVGALSAYASFYGVEAAITMVNDFGDELETDKDPLATFFRLSYSFIASTSINTVAIVHQDWSNAASKIGSKGQGFGDTAPIFDDESNEVVLSSYWFTERIQPGQMNIFLGFDANIWIEEPGFRTAVTAGVFANKNADTFLPNGARLQGSVIFQSDYHTEGASIPGFDGYLEAYWDLRYGATSSIPLLISFFMEYYLPLDEDPRDKLLFGGRMEFLF